MIPCDRFTQFSKPTFPNFAYSIWSSIMSSNKPLWCTNSNCSSALSFIQYPIIPKKVCKPSSLTWPVGGFSCHPKHTLIFLFNTNTSLKTSLHHHLEILVCQGTALLHNTQPPMPCSSINFKLTSVMSIYTPPTAIVTQASKYLRQAQPHSYDFEWARACILVVITHKSWYTQQSRDWKQTNNKFCNTNKTKTRAQ